MAAEFVTMRDGSGQSCHLLPPGQNFLADYTKALVLNDEGFLIGLGIDNG